ncbi:SDR family oxidoreductase [Streptomyces sp. CC224B]|uniref:SDR family oxidoreductase n=1 Tax=Streptomyces sp. CC224B TaxID=3044571 RepID=UPI0024A8D7F4|nr:SDR family oxidoreductase [Streptomyces sp. CC224B]
MRRSVLVTGATSGVGLETALRLARRGYDVFGTALDKDEADLLRAAAAARGVGVRTVLLDVTDPHSCEQAFDEVAAHTDGGPWALVNNAGILRMGAVEDLDDTTVHELFDVNLHGAARLTRLAVPVMRARGEGRVVNNSSLAGRVTAPLMGWYCATKAAMNAWNDALRMEVSPAGIQVVLIEADGYGSPIWDRAADALGALADSSSPHTSAYRAMIPALRAAARKPGPEPLIRAIVRALSAPRPKARQLVGVKAHLSALADPLGPHRVADHLKRAAVDLGGPARSAVVRRAAHRWCAPW